MNELTESQNTTPTTLSDRIAKLRTKAATGIETWQPEPGDTLAGILVGHQKAVGPYGENYQILIQDENGSTTAAWLTQWLKENLRAQHAETGDLIALTFLGKRMNGTRTYNAYSLIVERSDGS